MSVFNFNYPLNYFLNKSEAVEQDLNRDAYTTKKPEEGWTHSSSIHWGDVEDVVTPSIIVVVVLVGVLWGVEVVPRYMK